MARDAADAAELPLRQGAAKAKPGGARTFAISGGYEAIRRGLLSRGWQEGSMESSADLKWTLKSKEVDYAGLTPPQLTNHYERISELCTKHGLTRHLEEARGKLDWDVSCFYPQTFHLCGAGELEAFSTEYKLRKAEGVLKEWAVHREAGAPPSETFEEEVVRIALGVAKRHLEDIDQLLDGDENEAEVQGFSVAESEWAVLREVDMRSPAKELQALREKGQAAVHSENVKEQMKVALVRQVSALQKLSNKRLERTARRDEERLRREAMRHRLRRVVLSMRNVSTEQELPWQRENLRPAAKTSMAKTSMTSAGCGTMPQLDSWGKLTVDGAGVALHEAAPCSPATSSSAGSPTRKALPRQSSIESSASSPSGPSGEELHAEVSQILGLWRRRSPQFLINGEQNIWILKPAGRSRGVGIHLSDNLEEMLHTAQTGKSTTTWVCQKYIERPLLLKGRKHDIRQWVLVSSLNPLTVWFYGECYIRIAADTYTTDDLRNNLHHLTNNAIACHHPQFDKEDEYWQCMWDEATYRKHLRQEFGFDAYAEHVLPAMKRVVVATLTSTLETLAESQGADCCFELLGFDFFVDTELGVWLLEVNTSPSMDLSTTITARLVPEVLEDSLRVVLEDGPPESPNGRFELIHRGPSVEERSAKMVAAAAGLSLEGRRLQAPANSSPMSVLTLGGSWPDMPASEQQRLAEQRWVERRGQELDALVERNRRKSEKEQEKKARTERLRVSLRSKVLRSPVPSSMQLQPSPEGIAA